MNKNIIKHKIITELKKYNVRFNLRCDKVYEKYKTQIDELILEDVSAQQKIYNCVHDFINTPKCVCGKNRTFINFSTGYSKFCCRACSNKYKNKRQKITYNQIKDKLEKYSDKYIPIKSSYIDSTTKMNFLCIKHNIEYSQLIDNFLKGHIGCPECKKLNSKFIAINFEEIEKTFLQKHKIDHFFYFKQTYINKNIPMMIFCLKCCKLFFRSPINHEKAKWCPNCRYTTKKPRISISDIKIKYTEKHGQNRYFYFWNTYKNVTTKMTMICLKCGLLFKQTPDSHFSSGCPQCAKQKISQKNSHSIDEIINTLKKYTTDFYFFHETIVNNTKEMKIKCLKCNATFDITPEKFKGLPKCRSCDYNISINEKIIKKTLEFNKIHFVQQKTFNNCLSLKNNKLRFDFYLPEYNTCIEYDGEGHFMIIDEWGGCDGFAQTLIHDKIKDIYCKENSIKLIRIPYWEKDNIEKIINNLF